MASIETALQHHQAGRLAQAEAIYRQILEQQPQHADALQLLGVIAYQIGNNTLAVELYRKSLEIKPNPAVYKNLATALCEQGKLDEAAAGFRQALGLQPNYAEAHCKLGEILHKQGKLDDAISGYRQALALNPDYAEAHNSLGIAFHDQGKLDDAVTCYMQACKLQSDFAEALGNLGLALHDLGKLDEALACYQRALKLRPDYAESHNNLGNALQAHARLDAAVISHQNALTLKPDFAEAYNCMGNTLRIAGKLDEAVVCYRQALNCQPDHSGAYSNLLFCLSHNTNINADSLFSEHCRFGEQFEKPFRVARPPHRNSRDPERTLQIGFVSGDLRNHAVTHFIEPVLMHLSRYPDLSLHAYCNHIVADPVTQRLKRYFKHWHFIVGLSDAALAEKIRSDHIDILIDLSGHTAKNRLLTFARKPAPLQASWIGYPGSTGLQAMDYYLADRFFLPNATFWTQFTEKIVFLPAIAPFQPCRDAPEVNTAPAQNNGFITFASFNRVGKLSRSVIALWSQLLRAAPDAKILMGAIPPERCKVLMDWFTEEGISRARVQFYPKCGLQDYLRLHQRADICLDTFPYNGGTTTCHALWMGVPTLTLSGNTPAGRDGATVLSHVGLQEFIAVDHDDFVKKGLLWTQNIEELAHLRRALRERCAQSAMGRPELIAASLHHAMRILWRRWCEDIPPDNLDLSHMG